MWTSAVAVQPWVGLNYNNPVNFQSKTLILGESNFTKAELFSPNLVIDCVRNDASIDGLDDRDTTGFCRFSTKIRRTIFGIDETVGPYDFWQDVAFYNYVQLLVGENARIRPTQEMWDSSAAAFREVVRQLRPGIVLVLGKANWQNLTSQFDCQTIDSFSGWLNVDGKQVLSGYINHPSSSFAYSTWQPVARRLLNMSS